MRLRTFHAMAACVSLGWIWVGCAATARAEQRPSLSDYKLVFSDDFNGNTLDLKKWEYRTGPRLLSFQKPENVRVGGGYLHIDLKKESAGGLHYTAGGVISRQKFLYGYYEARFRCPKAAGWHTSFWTIGDKVQEIDICEQDASNGRSYSAGVIDWSGRGGKKSRNFGRVYYEGKDVPDFSADFHVWGCEFTPTETKFYLDGKLTHQTDSRKFPHGPNTIWLTSVAVLWGKPEKPKRIDDAALPAEALFDYVRFYEKKGDAKK